MAEKSPEELERTNEEEELNSINPLNEEDAPVEEPTEPVEDPTEVEPEPEPEPVEPESETEPVEEEIRTMRTMRTMSTVEPASVEEPESGIEQTKIRRNKKMKYGLKEVADVIFFDVGTDRPVLVFDTSK